MQSGNPPSLARRLSVWYALSAFLLLAIGTAILYWELVHRFDQQNDQYLTEKIASLETLLHDPSQPLPTVQWEVEEESLATTSVHVMSRILAANGSLLFETTGMSKELPTELLVFPADQGDTRATEVRSTSGKQFRVLTAKTAANSHRNRGPFQIQVAVDLAYQQNLLSSYRDRLWIVLGFGLVTAVLIGHRIARVGIAPVQEMAATVRRIRSNTLNERLRLGGLPRELSELADTFNETLDSLEDAFERLSRFSSDLAHELRTPIGNIRGELEVALARARTPLEYREVLGSSLEECEKLSRLIDRLLFLARAERPEGLIQREDLDLPLELEALLEFYEPAASERGIRMNVSVSEGVIAGADRTLLQVAVGNLLENAIHHTSEGGVITLAARPLEDSLTVSVSDTGVGIPSDHLPHVFERFYRVDPAREHKEGGAGLGLALVQTVARLHGGRAEIESEFGRGTCVTLHFPRSAEASKITKT
jgi:two-component system heavy metal sensor histidine kinase CusS